MFAVMISFCSLGLVIISDLKAKPGVQNLCVVTGLVPFSSWVPFLSVTMFGVSVVVFWSFPVVLQ